MFPVICTIGPLTVYAYGLMLAVAVLVCTFLLSRDARQKGISSDLILDFVFVVVVSGILGARVFYVLLNHEYFFADPVQIIMIHNGGLAWQGGLTAGALAGIWFVKNKNLAVLPFLDLCAPYLALGQSIGRIGCFLNGCCFGREIPWGIYFPVHDARLHPAQLYSTLGLFIIFLVLKAYQKRSARSGEVFVLYLVMASTLRFFIEFFRADHYETILHLSVYQLLSLGIFIVACYAHIRLKSRNRA